MALKEKSDIFFWYFLDFSSPILGDEMSLLGMVLHLAR